MGRLLLNLSLFDFPRGGGLLVESFSPEYPRFLGSFSAFYPLYHRREVLAPAHVIVPGADFLPPGWGWSPGEIAREILRARRGPRWPEAENWRRVEQMRPPALVIPGCWEDCVLVDIQRAYESILRRWGVRQVDPLRFFSKSLAWEIPKPYWTGPGEKHVLRILPAIGLGGRILFQEGPGKVAWRKSLGRDCRPWGTVMVVLAGVAEAARRLGARYWNVDGGIIPIAGLGELRDFCAGAGLVLREKARGTAEVKCLGAYRVGGWVSGHFSRVRITRAVEPDSELWEWSLGVISRECVAWRKEE